MKNATNEMTTNRAMFYAIAPGGLSGETIRAWPASYLVTHIVPEGGVYAMAADQARVIDGLLSLGWVERVVKTINVPADEERFSMFCGTPAHVLTLVSYRATAKGRAEWTMVA